MAEYLIQDTSLTAIADEVRTLSGTTGTMSPIAMATNIGDANTEIDNQVELIAQISAVLEGKAGGSSGVSMTTADFTYTEEMGDEPGMYNYVLTSGSLLSSTRSIINIYATSMTGVTYIWKAISRASLSDSFVVYNGDTAVASTGRSVTIGENTITILDGYISDEVVALWFVAI